MLTTGAVKLNWLMLPAVKMAAASKGVIARFQTPRSSILKLPWLSCAY